MWELVLTLVKQLRKLWAMLGNLLPGIGAPGPLRRRIDGWAARPVPHRILSWLAEWRLTRALRLVWQRFVWRDYSGDRVTLAELPDDVADVTLSLAAQKPGHLRSLSTTRLISPEETMQAMERASGIAYRGPRDS